jgi:hypothetical protein
VLLKKFSKARSKYLVNEKNISRMIKTLDGNYEHIGKLERKTVNGTGTCECGKFTSASHDDTHDVFDEDVNSEMNNHLKSLLHMSCFNHKRYIQEHKLYQRQIEQMTAELMNQKSFSHINKDSPVVLCSFYSICFDVQSMFFEDIVKLMTQTSRKNDWHYMDESKISGHHLIKSIVFSSKFISIM